MPRTCPPYHQKFREKIAELARNRRSPKELAEEVEPTQTMICNWLKQTAQDEGIRSDGPTTEDKEETRRGMQNLRPSVTGLSRKPLGGDDHNEVQASYRASVRRTGDKTHARLNTQRKVLSTIWGR